MIIIIIIINAIYNAEPRMTSNSRAGACADANGSLGEGWAVEEESNSILKTNKNEINSKYIAAWEKDRL